MNIQDDKRLKLEQDKILVVLETSPLLKPSYVDVGRGLLHNMPCCVYSDTEHAVHYSSTEVFNPSWKAQSEGWQLVQAKTKFQRWLLVNFFNMRG